MRTIDAEALKEDFKARLRIAQNWKEYAINRGDDEIAIIANAIISFICEVILTIDNAPTVDITEEQAIDKLHETGWLPKHDKEMTERRPGEWIRKVDKAGFISHICSECGAEIEVEDCSDDKFCFNCGAYMKGGAE